MLYLLVISLFINYHNVFGYDQPSFRSSWSEDGKPILRMGPPRVDDSQSDRKQETDVDWVKNLKTRVDDLVKTKGLDEATSQIRTLVDDTELKQNVLLRVEAPTPEPDPQWLVDFKTYIKNMIEAHGDEHLDDYIRGMVEYHEKHTHVIIRDIDGELEVKWTPKSNYGS